MNYPGYTIDKMDPNFNRSMFLIIFCYVRFQFYCSDERTHQRLGQLLIDIASTFEDEFHEIEVRSKNKYCFSMSCYYT